MDENDRIISLAKQRAESEAKIKEVEDKLDLMTDQYGRNLMSAALIRLAKRRGIYLGGD